MFLFRLQPKLYQAGYLSVLGKVEVNETLQLTVKNTKDQEATYFTNKNEYLIGIGGPNEIVQPTASTIFNPATNSFLELDIHVDAFGAAEADASMSLRPDDAPTYFFQTGNNIDYHLTTMVNGIIFYLSYDPKLDRVYFSKSPYYQDEKLWTVTFLPPKL